MLFLICSWLFLRDLRGAEILRSGITGLSTLLMMEGYNFQEILNRVKEEAKIAPPGFLQKGKTMESLIGHTVINLSDETLSKNTSKCLRKRPNFLPYTRTTK